MKKSWISDMLNFLGVYYEGKVDNSNVQLRKSEGQLLEVNSKKSEIERSIRSLKSIKNNNFVLSLGLFFLLRVINPGITFMVALGYYFVSNTVIASVLSGKKARVEQYEMQIASLEKEIARLKENLDFAKSGFNTDNFIDAEIINEYPDDDSDNINKTSTSNDINTNTYTGPSYPGSLPEAAATYMKMDEMKEILPVIKEKDYSLYVLFNNAYKAADKVRVFIQSDNSKEGKAYLFYNNVETLHKWADGIRDLYEADVYESLLINIKNQATAALPVLQEKINKDYYKIVYPDIMDNEAEMTVMSKEKGN
ncbi:MAG: hypothetical protein QMB63_04230 [Clostridiaceae bacterium]